MSAGQERVNIIKKDCLFALTFRDRGRIVVGAGMPNRQKPKGWIASLSLAMTSMHYRGTVGFVFETIAGAERERVEKINTTVPHKSKFLSDL